MDINRNTDVSVAYHYYVLAIVIENCNIELKSHFDQHKLKQTQKVSSFSLFYYRYEILKLTNLLTEDLKKEVC